MLKNSIEGYSEMDISTKNPCKLQGLAGGRKVREMTWETLPLPFLGPSNEAAAVSRITAVMTGFFRKNFLLAL
jgi:hypothetical protein